MSYFTGTANTATALRTAIFAACAADGWTVESPVMSNGSQAMQIDLNTYGTSQGVRFKGGKSVSAGALVGASPRHVSMGDRNNLPFSWPATYHVFSFANPDEVFVVVNYNVDRFQWAAWGRSVHSLPGTGMWFGSIFSTNADTTAPFFSLNISGGLQSSSYTQPALFWRDAPFVGVNAGYSEVEMHHGLDGDLWTECSAGKESPFAFNSANPLLSILPNSWNSEAVLVPIQALVVRASNMSSLAVTVQNARYLRIDNYAPGELITLGADRWMVFPWLRKNTTLRNGMPSPSNTAANLQTGTLGWAIRYEGP